ncbi:hypothetical protein [Microbacterium paraoxydans]|uniref:hypothetical protein n=1 Tax=Microbacterium paraoxydans TaxID=199592 RepID=UPI003D72E850
MSAAIEHKSVDGKAVITDTRLIYEFGLLARVQRQSKRTEIPLDGITEIKLIPGTPTYLQVAVEGWTTSDVPNLSGLAFAINNRDHEPFVAALRAATGVESVSTVAGSQRSAKPSALPSAEFGGYKLRDGVLKGGGKSVSVQGAEAEATQGAPSQRSTLTRMGAGALIAGPIGFVVGAVARKNTSKCYVTIGVPDGVVVIESKAKEFPDALRFADAVNRAAQQLGAE